MDPARAVRGTTVLRQPGRRHGLYRRGRFRGSGVADHSLGIWRRSRGRPHWRGAAKPSAYFSLDQEPEQGRARQTAACVDRVDGVPRRQAGPWWAAWAPMGSRDPSQTYVARRPRPRHQEAGTPFSLRLRHRPRILHMEAAFRPPPPTARRAACRQSLGCLGDRPRATPTASRSTIPSSGLRVGGADPRSEQPGRLLIRPAQSPRSRSSRPSLGRMYAEDRR